jgi:hypothetical protein
MTTPNVTSPNVRILVPEVPLPADAPKSQTPLAEAALAELLQGGRLGIRDMLRPVNGEQAEWPYLDVLRAGLAAIDADHADAEKAAKAEAAGAFTEAGEREKEHRETPWWDKTPMTPSPEAHPYPVPAPVAAPEPEPAADEPAPVTDATAVLKDIAAVQEAAKEPDDATTVIALDKAETEAMPTVPAEDAGEQA